MQLAVLLAGAAALSSAAMAAPSAAQQYSIKVIVSPSSPYYSDYNGATLYRETSNEFGGSRINLAVPSKSTPAGQFTLQTGDRLKSAAGYGLHLDAIEGGNSSVVHFVPYCNTLTTHVVMPSMQVVAMAQGWHSWLLCSSQYGAELAWANSNFNLTRYNDGLKGTPDMCGYVGLSAIKA